MTFSEVLLSVASKYVLKGTDTIVANQRVMRVCSLLTVLKDEFEQKKTKELPLYFAYLIDFRGRVYVNSPISITDLKFLRHIISPYAEVSYHHKIKKNSYFQQILRHKSWAENLDSSESDMSDEKAVVVLIGLLQIGKAFKSKIEGFENGVDIEKLIKLGFLFYQQENKTALYASYGMTNPDDQMGVEIGIEKLRNFIKHGEEFCIIVDCTASSLLQLNL